MRVVAIVPAAGEGRRLSGHGHPRKQFRSLGGLPLLVRTVEALAAHESVSGVIVAVPAEEVTAVSDDFARLAETVAVQVVAGGATRQQSVARALAAITGTFDLVAVHDGVRPFLPLTCLDAVLRRALDTGGAALAIPVADTLRRVDEDSFGETQERAGLWRMQTPQVFHPDVLHAAHAAADGIEATDDVELVTRLGQPVHVVPGSTFNVKITTPSDWQLARMVWPFWQRVDIHQE